MNAFQNSKASVYGTSGVLMLCLWASACVVPQLPGLSDRLRRQTDPSESWLLEPYGIYIHDMGLDTSTPSQYANALQLLFYELEHNMGWDYNDMTAAVFGTHIYWTNELKYLDGMRVGGWTESNGVIVWLHNSNDCLGLTSFQHEMVHVIEKWITGKFDSDNGPETCHLKPGQEKCYKTRWWSVIRANINYFSQYCSCFKIGVAEVCEED